MDDVDRAQAINEAHIQEALDARLWSLSNLRTDIHTSRTTCLDCQKEIPEARRQAVPGCLRCIDCQTLLENWRPL